MPHQPYSEDVIEIEGEYGVYRLTASQLEDVLMADGQMCQVCGDTGYYKILAHQEGGEIVDDQEVKCSCKINNDL